MDPGYSEDFRSDEDTIETDLEQMRPEFEKKASHFNSQLTALQVEKIVRYAYNGLNQSEIAKALDVSERQVENVWKTFCDRAVRRGARIFQANKADILSLFQKKMLYSITEDEIKSMSPSQRILAFGILFDKERLLLGKPTAISGVFTIVSGLRSKQKEISKRIEELRRKTAKNVEKPGKSPGSSEGPGNNVSEVGDFEN